MPFIHVHIAAGRPLDKRRRLAEAITTAVSDILEIEPGATQVLIQEHDRDSWAIGGELLSERRSTQKDVLSDLDSLFRKPPEKKPATVKTPVRKPAARSRSRR